jgi:hypothetical protein
MRNFWNVFQVEQGSFCEPPPRARAEQQHLLGALHLFALADRDALGRHDLPGSRIYALDDG